MLRASLFILAPLLSAGLVAMFGFAALAACFGLCLLTLVCSTEGVPEEHLASDIGAETAAVPL